MKLVTRAVLSLLLITNSLYGQGGEFSLENDRQFLIEPGNPILEHALWDFHHYFPQAGDIKFCDASLNPLYKHWKERGGNGHINTAGAFIQCQLNFESLWLRANTIFGTVHQKEDTTHRSHFDIDDVLMKLGYDVSFREDRHTAFYLVAGFPTNRNLESNLILENSSDVTSGKLTVQTPELGTKHYRFGAGINCGRTLVGCEGHQLALLFDFQYHYAFPTDYISCSPNKITDTFTVHDEKKARFTPGHTIVDWTAFHYVFGSFNIEVGSAFTTTFGEKIVSFEAHTSKQRQKGDSNSEGIITNVLKETFGQCFIRAPDVIKFGATPYVAVSYSGTVCDYPSTIGLGVAYDYNHLDLPFHTRIFDRQRLGIGLSPSHFQGFMVWLNASMSF